MQLSLVVEANLFFSLPFLPAWFVIISYMCITIIAMVVWLIKRGNRLEP